MKKYILLVTAAATTAVGFAQNNKVVSAYNYNKAFTKSQKCNELKLGIEAINEAKEHEKTKGKAKTWYYRGNLYYNVLATKKEECKAIDPNALEECTNSYLKALVLNFEDPELKKLDLMKEDGSDMMKFFTALQSKSAVDDEMYTADIMGRKFPGLAAEYANKGIGQFGEKDYKGAQESFGMSLALNQFAGKMDTMMMYNMALAAEYGEDTEAAMQIYDGLIALGYNVDGNGPGLYVSMYRMHKAAGNEEKAAEYIANGRKKYPNDNNLIAIELESFLQGGKHEEALANLNTAIENDPNNALFYFARGTVYENLKNQDEAVKNYEKAIELDPKYFDAYFNLGAYYFNIGADKTNEARDLPLNESKKYDALLAESKEYFNKAIPYVEKAHEVNPSDVDAGNMLIKLYTKTNQMDKAGEIKAKFQ